MVSDKKTLQKILFYAKEINIKKLLIQVIIK